MFRKMVLTVIAMLAAIMAFAPASYADAPTGTQYLAMNEADRLVLITNYLVRPTWDRSNSRSALQSMIRREASGRITGLKHYEELYQRTETPTMLMFGCFGKMYAKGTGYRHDRGGVGYYGTEEQYVKEVKAALEEYMARHPNEVYRRMRTIFGKWVVSNCPSYPKESIAAWDED